MPKLKVGIIGLGVGEQHIAGYRQHPHAEVVALADFQAEKLARAREQYPAMQLYSEADALIEDPAIQVVSIASYDNHHYSQIVKCLERGKHIFVEKPIVLYPEELRHIRELLNKNPQLKISSNLILRKYPRFVALKERIRSGQMGQLFALEGDYNYGRIHKIQSGWRGEIDYYSVMMGGGVHLIDLLLWLSQDRVERVAAFGNRISSEGSAFKHNDMVMALLYFSSGMVAKISANFGCVYPHFHDLRIYGTKASFINTPQGALFYTSRNKEDAPLHLQEAYPGANKGDLISSFVESILTGKEAEVPQEDIFATMSVCFAIEEAMRKAKIVDVCYI